MMAYELNDVTLPPERGFPLQLVAEGKYGYKWAKWIVDRAYGLTLQRLLGESRLQ